jgi:hypothetical protein
MSSIRRLYLATGTGWKLKMAAENMAEKPTSTVQEQDSLGRVSICLFTEAVTEGELGE